MASQKVLFLQQVAEQLGVPERTVRDWAKKHIIRAQKLGKKKWVFEHADVLLSERRLARREGIK